MSKSASLVRVLIAYVLTIVAGLGWLLLGPSLGSSWADALVAHVIATLVIFAFSRAYGNSSFYDAFWSVIPPLLVLYWWIAEGVRAGDPAAWMVMIVVLAWAIRLTGNWMYGFPGLHHEDWRYEMLRQNAGRWEFWVDFLGIHLFPTLQVFLATVPAYLVMSDDDRSLNPLHFLALVVGLSAVALQLTADTQLHRFVAIRRPGQILHHGLWAWSRHPNYLGEIGFWFSLALFGLASAPGSWWWVFAGAAAMLAMFLGASIPMMEKRSLERRPDYQQVIDSTPMLVLWPPRNHDRQGED